MIYINCMHVKELSSIQFCLFRLTVELYGFTQQLIKGSKIVVKVTLKVILIKLIALFDTSFLIWLPQCSILCMLST